MTDSTDKKTKKISDQDNQHESLHHGLNSVDNKVKEKSDNFDIDLDAMLDKAEFSLAETDEFQDEEDAIDRLLVNAAFDIDDELLQASEHKEVDTTKDHDELDDFLSFDDFGEEFNELETAQTVSLESGNLDAMPLNEAQDDEDDLDRLVMNTALDADYAPGQARQDKGDALEKLDSFSDFSDFNEPTQVDVAPRDELDEFLSLIDDVDESDMILDDDVSIPAKADSIDSIEKSTEEEDEELDKFSDFSDFSESDIISAVEEVVAPDQSTGEPSFDIGDNADDTGLSDESDDFFRVEGLGGDVAAEPYLDQKDKDEASIPVSVDLNASTEDETLAGQNDIDAIDELNDFSDFNDFNEPEIAPSTGIEEPEQIIDSSMNDGNPAEEFDEFADFDGFGEGFDESDMIQDDEVEDSANFLEPDKNQEALIEQSFDDISIVDSLFPDEQDVLGQTAEIVGEANGIDEFDLIQDDTVVAAADLVIADEEEPSVSVEESVSDVQDDESSFNSLFADADFNEEDMLEQADDKDDALVDDATLPDEIDDFSGFGDDFSESDLIQDDELGASIDSAAANEELPLAVEELANDVQNDEDSFNSLFADADFGEEDVLEQAEEKKDEFDDASLSEIDSFFQLSEDSDAFSVQVEDGQLADEKSLIQDGQEDDFLLPDFDITADTEISDTLVDTEIKENDFSDAFGDADLFSENEGAPASPPEVSETKSGDSEALAEPTPKPEADTAIGSIENTKLNPFDFELDDLKKQLAEAENKVKKAKRYSYMAMGFGMVALSAAAGLGFMTYGAKTEVSKLTEAVTTLEANLAKSAANSPSQEIDSMRSSVGSLNKQVDGFITELKGNPQFPNDLLNNRVLDIVSKQDMVSKALDMLQVKVGNLEEKASLASSVPAIVQPPKIEAVPEPVPAPVKEENVHEIEPIKAAPEHEQVKNIDKHDNKPHDVKAESIHEQAPAKKEVVHEQASNKDKSTSEVAPIKLKPRPEVVVTEPIVPAKPVIEEKPVRISRPAVTGKWGINLVAFKQEWFAKSKAAEFARLGVFAEVIPVYEKGAMMYRLRVSGFKSKAEANSNTAKIKQMLNLDSVWVSDN